MACHPFSSLAGHAQSDGHATPRENFSFLGDLGNPGHHYDPNQPRVPAGHPDGGQWTRIGGQVGARVLDRGGEILSDVSPFWILGGQYAANDNWDDLDRSHSGRGPRTRHQVGVAAAVKDFESKGYRVIPMREVAVIVPGFATPRVYDFIAQDPIDGSFIGVEVKTTLYDLIRLKLQQVEKDVAVVRSHGRVPSLKGRIEKVSYVTYCWGCDRIPNLKSFALTWRLMIQGIPFTHHGAP